MNILLAPDVYVNASVALGSPPERVVSRVLGKGPPLKTTEWVLSRVASMLASIPEFKKEAVEEQVGRIRELVDVLEVAGDFGPGAWREALVAAARGAGVERVVTDHPDLLELESSDGIEFLSTEAWLLEAAIPPPPPPPR